MKISAFRTKNLNQLVNARNAEMTLYAENMAFSANQNAE